MKQHLSIAVQGTLASFHDLAARQYFGQDIDLVGCGSFEEVCQKLANNQVDYGVIAIENRIAGSILMNYQLIENYKLNIIGETYLPVELFAMALPGVTLKEVNEIYSHPMALGQCQRFLAELTDVAVHEYKDTAGSAENLVLQQERATAIIAGKAVASAWKLDIISPNICDERENYTRFYVLSKGKTSEVQPNKASISVRLKEQPGALHKLLESAALRGLNLSKIQSIPLTGKELAYAFHLDIDFTDSLILDACIEEMRTHSEHLHVLGIYKKDEIPQQQ